MDEPNDTPLETNDEGDLIVPLDDDQGTPLPTDGAVQFSDDEPNLVPVFMGTKEGRLALKDISDRVSRDFDADWEASSEYRRRVAEDNRLRDGDLPPKEYPFKNCANAHVPSMLELESRLTARIEDEVFGDWSEVAQFLPTGAMDKDWAEAVTLHSNWQVREKLDGFQRQMSRAVLMFTHVGDVTVHSYWDPLRRQNTHETLTPDEFVTPYVYVTTKTDYSDLPHYTKICRRYRHEMEAMRDDWFDVDRVIEKKKPSFEDEPDSPIREARAELEGIETPEDGEAPYKILWYEGWLELPGRDTQRWCQVIMDHATKALLCVSIHEEVNWQEQQRFEQQSAEMASYQQGVQAHQDAHAQIAQNAETLQTHLPNMHPGAAEPVVNMLAQHQAQIQPPPPPPAWMKTPAAKPAPPRKDPIYMFAHGVCIESLTGNLGLSFGRILADLNRAQDVALSAFIDAAHLANTGFAMTTEQVEMEDPIEIAPGAFLKLPGVTAGQIDANVKFVSFPPANGQLLQLVETFGQMAEAAMQAPNVLSGEPGKSGETFRGINTRVEQATKALTVPTRHFCLLFAQVMRNNAKLNATYLDDEEVFQVLNHAIGQYQTVTVGKKMYERNYSVSVIADLSFTSKAQRITEADELLAMPRALPPLQSNLGFQYATAVLALRARGRSDIIPRMGAAPPDVPVFGQPTFPPPPIPPQGGATPPKPKGAPTPPNGPPSQDDNNSGVPGGIPGPKPAPPAQAEGAPTGAA